MVIATYLLSNTLIILGMWCHQKNYSLNVGILNPDFTYFDLLLVLILEIMFVDRFKQLLLQ
jgi:hypothetical protein